jgi:hypothetical protein
LTNSQEDGIISISNEREVDKMKISIDTQACFPFKDLDAGDVFRYEDCFFIVVDLNPKDLGATDYIAVNLSNGAVDEDITDDTDVQYLANATLKA